MIGSAVIPTLLADAFYLPPLVERLNLTPGVLEGLGYVGRLRNDPILMDLTFDDEIAFSAKHMMNVAPKQT